MLKEYCLIGGIHNKNHKFTLDKILAEKKILGFLSQIVNKIPVSYEINVVVVGLGCD